MTPVISKTLIVKDSSKNLKLFKNTLKIPTTIWKWVPLYTFAHKEYPGKYLKYKKISFIL